MIFIPGDKFSVPIVLCVLGGLMGDLGIGGIVSSIFSIFGFFYLWVSALDKKANRKDALLSIISVVALISFLALFNGDIIRRGNWYNYAVILAFLFFSILFLVLQLAFIFRKAHHK